MKIMQNELFRMDRNELKKIVRETEEKARRNGWNPNPGTNDPNSEMKRDGKLGDEEFARYQTADAILSNTVDLDEGGVSGLGGSIALLRTLDDARKASYVYAPDKESALESRFDRIINSLALRLLVNAERKCVVPDAKKFVVSLEKHVTRPVEVEAADRGEAEDKAAGLADEDEFVSGVMEA